MPVMDGLESSRQIRAFERTLVKHDRATIIALTGVAQADVQRDAMASGMDFFLTKPARLDTISLIIKKCQGVKIDSVLK
jgi:CheY-like chemotaxis protein